MKCIAVVLVLGMPHLHSNFYCANFVSVCARACASCRGTKVIFKKAFFFLVKVSLHKRSYNHTSVKLSTANMHDDSGTALYSVIFLCPYVIC